MTDEKLLEEIRKIIEENRRYEPYPYPYPCPYPYPYYPQPWYPTYPIYVNGTGGTISYETF